MEESVYRYGGKRVSNDCPVSEIMSRNVMTISENLSLKDAFSIMNTRRFASLAVTADGTKYGKVIGIITRADLKRYPYSEYIRIKVKEAMSRNPILLENSTPISEVENVMNHRRFGSILIGKNGHLDGVVTRKDIIRRAFIKRGVETELRNSDKMIKDGDGVADNKKLPEYTSPKESAGLWARLFHTRDPEYWKETFQKELNTRWEIFDKNFENLYGEWEAFKKSQMEISEINNICEKMKEEWTESLTSLGNLINKNTSHERVMWTETLKGRKIGGLKVRQKFNESDIDEIRFNNMMDYIKQYPELQAQKTIDKAVDAVREKRNEILNEEKTLREKIKNTNVYLNTAKSKILRVEHKLKAFETIEKAGAKKLHELENKLSAKILSVLKTAAEKESLHLFLFEYDRKIGDCKEQLKLIRQDLKDYQNEKFVPIVTKKFEDIKD